MIPLKGKNVAVIGGSRGVGRQIVQAALGSGARVLAVARQDEPLLQLAREVPGTEVLSLDATHEGAPPAPGPWPRECSSSNSASISAGAIPSMMK